MSALLSLCRSLKKDISNCLLQRNSNGEKNYYKKLFDLIDKAGSAEKQVIQKLCPDENLTGKQFKIHKHRLSDQILNSLAAHAVSTDKLGEIKNGIRNFLMPSSQVARDMSLSNQLEEDLIAVYKLAIFLKNTNNF